MNRRTLIGGLFAAASVPALSACASGITSLDGQGGSTTGGGSSRGGVTIGTANFTENQVLGYLYAAVLEAAGVKTTVRPNLGTREILIPALKGGDIDLLPEYQGALLHYLDPKATATEEGEMQNALAAALPSGLQILPYGMAEDSDAFVVTRETARKYGLASLADLKKQNGRLVIGASLEYEASGRVWA
ncbi:ABC transporter substrate-binding protein [Streptomyces viridochromogenes DSM 40736]|uniref:ABC transporter substrate-binding protein n=1 Tax=Streptomyces viridochromogenes (strain DSM 40736 / JCM 4977 / BCRC 1201 / Tue 494) TaxID=591159 RepID=D9XG67_STRVT|nr:ABC transporter substrate-binding protein [Streptomyces viridochromogenes DSM 40736]